jgi:hypothetical protein
VLLTSTVSSMTLRRPYRWSWKVWLEPDLRCDGLEGLQW